MALIDNIVAAWKLNEESAGSSPVTRVDSHGSNNLSDNNTVASISPGKIARAATFVAANNEYLSIPDNADLSAGDIDFTIALWVNVTTKVDFMAFISKWIPGSSGTNEYTILYDVSIDRFQFIVTDSSSSSTIVDANNFGSPSTGTWYLIVAWHDSVANTINIQVNNGTPNSSAHSTGIRNGTNDFRLGSFGNNTFPHNGSMDEVSVWKKVLTADERTELYNLGNGLTYDFSTITDVVSIIDPSGGGDFTSLNSWEPAAQRNLAGALERERARCRAGDVVTGSLVLDGWNTSPAGRIVIEGDPSFKHEGIFTTTGIAYMDWGTDGMEIREVVTIADMVSTGTGPNQHFNFLAGSEGSIVERCILRGKSIGITADSLVGSIIVRNSILQDQTINLQANVSTTTLRAFNNTVVNSGTTGGDGSLQANNSSSIVENNNYLSRLNASPVNYLEVSGGTITRGATTATDNAEAITAGLRNIPFDGTTFIDVTGVYDLHLKSGSLLIDVGTNLFGTEGFTDEIEGFVRPVGVAWDIGASEFGAGGPPFYKIDNFSLRSALFKRGSVSYSSVSRSTNSSVIGYHKNSVRSVDQATSVRKLSSREVEGRYSIPSSSFFHQTSIRSDLSSGKRSRRWSEVEVFDREYSDGGEIIIDGPCMTNSLIPHSYIHPLENFAVESASFSSLINVNGFAIGFWWSPTFSFSDLQGNSLEIFRVEVDSNNYISIEVKSGNEFEREYSRDNVYGPHDPTFVIKKVRAGVETTRAEVIGAYFGYDMSSQSSESNEDFQRITAIHHSGGVLGIRVERYGIIGESSSNADPASYVSSGFHSVKYTGIGYYGSPEVLSVYQKLASGTRRKAPTGRPDTIRRTIGRRTDAILAGERDPTNGLITSGLPFVDTDDFNRIDSASIGSNWGIVKETGVGWGIESNRAVCAETGYQFWDRFPSHADYIIKATVRIENTNNIIGLLARMDLGGSVNADEVFGYGVEVEQTGVSSAVIRVVRFYNSVKEILESSSVSSYTASTDFIMRVRTSGSIIIGEITTAADTLFLTPTGIISATDTVYRKPGITGIYGITGGVSQKVRLDDWSLSPNFENSIV